MITVEVGPVTIRGPAPVDDELAVTAVESIDDTLMLVGDRPLEVRTVIGDLLGAAAGPEDDELAVVCPSWWSGRRVDVVRDAADGLPRAVSMLTRSQVIGDGSGAVVEIAPDHVAVIASGSCIVARNTDEAVCAAVVRELDCEREVFVDAPPGVGGGALASALIAALRARGVAAARTGARPLRVAPRAPEKAAVPPPRRARRGVAPALAGVVVAASGAGAAAIAHDDRPVAVQPTTLLVEGHAGVVVPASWTVRRMTDGSGSARVQITSPADPAVALHVTQSALPRAQSLGQVADTLRTSLEAQPPGVFTDFRAADHRGGRAVVTYRERRAEHETAWAVLADGTLRIAVGCQSPPGHADVVRQVCDAAVHSAHAVF